MQICSKCKKQHRRIGQRYCLDCHAAYMRANRPKHSGLSAEQKKKVNCRSYAKTYKYRGVLKQEPCKHCGSADSQMHHEDYDSPLDVTWLCRQCHLLVHEQDNIKHVKVKAHGHRQ